MAGWLTHWLAPVRYRLVLVIDWLVRALARSASTLGIPLQPRLLARLLTGAVAVRLMPSALEMAARGKRIVLVTGTNGKTTTTALLVAALGGGHVATNAGNHNFYCGLFDALRRSAASVAVLEVDELWLPAVLRWLTPELLIILNLYEDAWLRTPDPQYVAERWARALQASPIKIIAWADDPALVALLAGKVVHWISAPASVDPSPLLQACPVCGGILRRKAQDWFCACGMRHPLADRRCGTVWQLSADGEWLQPPHHDRWPSLRVKPGLAGRVNRLNAAFAATAAVLMGVEPLHVQQRLSHLQRLPLRDDVYRIAGRDIQLLVAKNPAAWRQLLDRLDSATSVILLQQQAAALQDLGWLYDLPAVSLRGRTVGVCGLHAVDLSVWLAYAQVDCITAADPRDLVMRMPAGPLLCLSDLLGAYLMESLAEPVA